VEHDGAGVGALNMAKGDMPNISDQDLGSIMTRVHHLERGLASLSQDMRDGFANVTKQIEGSRQPPYQLWGIMVTVMIGLASFVWWVVTDRQNTSAEQTANALKHVSELIRDIDQNMVSQKEFTLTTERGREYRVQVAENIAAMRADLQRQIDEIKKSQGDTYTVRDAIMEIKSRQRELEETILNR